MILPCGHTYCYRCIERIIKKKIKCPNCRALVPSNINPASLTVNYALISIIDGSTTQDGSNSLRRRVDEVSFKELFNKPPQVFLTQSKAKIRNHFRGYWHLYVLGMLSVIFTLLFFKFCGVYLMNGFITFGIFLVITSHGKFKKVSTQEGEYHGEVVQRKMEGQGRFIFRDGDRVNGSWKGNKLDGKASYKFANGAELKGVWKDGRLVKIEKFKDLDSLPAYFNQQSRITKTYMPQLDRNLHKIQ